ncbi:hypothetical protein LJB42_001126 [Komagataella kurtzmanii]|nr:hypothetical protein LJB42_001126 [Komagataella kurtzmanii]
MSKEDQPKCPVDHEAQAVWLQKNNQVEQASAQRKSAPEPETSSKSWWKWSSPSEKKSEPKSLSEVPASCPVDHDARSRWIENVSVSVSAPDSVECSSDALPEQPTYSSNIDLPTDREISSIPRTGADLNWIYPSQKQFFEAMRRKDWNPHAKDMKSIVPIHNAVNEQAWKYIQMWEHGKGGQSCGGIQLTSFKGDSKKLTPRARWRLFLGYERPFDRHDWTIDRCGTQVDYVIDFYGGKPNPKNPQMPSFYLDVRPKLNSIEGVKLRLFRALGL